MWSARPGRMGILGNPIFGVFARLLNFEAIEISMATLEAIGQPQHHAGLL